MFYLWGPGRRIAFWALVGDSGPLFGDFWSKAGASRAGWRFELFVRLSGVWGWESQGQGGYLCTTWTLLVYLAQ